MMRGFIALLLLALLVVNLILVLQVQGLQNRVAALQNNALRAERAETSPSALLEHAMPLLAQAREAVQDADFDRARSLLKETTDRANQMSRAVDEKSAPVVAWLREQVKSLEAQMRKK